MIPDDLKTFLAGCGLARERMETTNVLRRLYDDLRAVNETTNLTSLTSEEDFLLLHVADSLAVGLARPELMHDALSVADVGCGAGFPMFPLAWANPKLRITGLEPRKRRAAFVEREIAALGMDNCRVLPRQAREAGRLDDHANRYDFVLLRAVGEAGRLLRHCRNLLTKKAGGKIVFYKTPQAIQQERPVTAREAEKFGFDVIESAPIALPREAGERQFLILQRR